MVTPCASAPACAQAFGAVRRGPDSEIAIEADLEPAAPRALRRPLELAVGEPLAEEGELEAVAVALDRPVDRFGFAVAQIVGPKPPVLARLHVRRRLEGGEPAQGFAARSRKRMVTGDERIGGPRLAQAGERRASRFERRALGAPHLDVLDISGCRSGGESRRQRLQRGAQRLVPRQARIVERVDEDRIDEAAIGGVIGARPLPIARKQHMQRAQAQIGRPGRAGRLARASER